MNNSFKKSLLVLSISASLMSLAACGGGGGGGNVRPNTPNNPNTPVVPPVVIDPTSPPVTDPTVPPVTDPTIPPVTDPTVPPVTDPTVPPVTDPTNPNDPSLPPVTDPTDPGNDYSDFWDITNPTHVPTGLDVTKVWNAPLDTPNNLWMNTVNINNSDALHNAGHTGTGVKVGIVDSGLEAGLGQINYSNVVYKDFVDGNTALTDDGGHGTAVAKVLAGNGLQYFHGGMAPDATLYVAHAAQNETLSSVNSDAAIQWQLSNGVKIINVSYDTTNTLSNAAIDFLRTNATNGDATGYEGDEQSLQAIIASNALVVYSAGNNGLANSASNTQAPLIFDQENLQRGILTVVATTAFSAGINGNVGDLATFSNRCGNTASYCLAAPGEYLLPTTANADGVYGASAWSGTSFAAPTVAGGAALVSQVFPWMTGDNLRQTLLTTATYHNDSTGTTADTGNGLPYNQTYGWGDLNTTKALSGPSMFYFGTFSANLTDGDYVFANDISGTGGLDVGSTGGTDGRLYLSGTNTYTGATNVFADTLVVTGSIANSNTTVSGTGLLTGNGTVGNLVNNANVATPSNGSLKVNGNYTQSPLGTLSVNLGSPLLVAGTASLDGQLNVLLPTDDYIVNSTENLLHANNGVSGVFLTVNPGVFLSGTVSYGSNDVNGEFVRIPAVSALASANIVNKNTVQNAVAMDKTLSVVDAWVANGKRLNDTQSSFVAKASAFEHSSSIASAVDTMQSLNGQIYATSNALTFESLEVQNHLVQNRLDSLDKTTSGAWAQVSNLNGRLGDKGDLGTAYQMTAGAFGLDTDFSTDNVRAGVAFTYGNINSNADSLGGNLKNKSYGILGYGRFNFNASWYASGSLSYQYGDNKTTRHALLDGYNTMSSENHTNALQLDLETGYKYQLNHDASLTPYVGVTQTHATASKFNEDGILGLHGDEQTYNRTLSRLGLKFDNKTVWSNGWWVGVSVYGEYQYAFNNPEMKFNGNFIATPNATPFAINGTSLTKEALWTGAGVSFGKGDKVKYYVNYDERLSSRGNAHAVSAGIEVKF